MEVQGVPRNPSTIVARSLGEWRNWQTRRLQVPVSERMWGFKSPLAHHLLAHEIPALATWSLRSDDRETIDAVGESELGAKECGRNYCNAIWPAICIGARCDYCGIKQSITQLLSEPVEMAHVIRVDGQGQLDLKRNNSPIRDLNDEVDLALSSLSA